MHAYSCMPSAVAPFVGCMFQSGVCNVDANSMLVRRQYACMHMYAYAYVYKCVCAYACILRMHMHACGRSFRVVWKDRSIGQSGKLQQLNDTKRPHDMTSNKHMPGQVGQGLTNGM